MQLVFLLILTNSKLVIRKLEHFRGSATFFLYLLGCPRESYKHVGLKRQRPSSHVGATVFLLEGFSSIFSGSPPCHLTNPALSPTQCHRDIGH